MMSRGSGYPKFMILTSGEDLSALSKAKTMNANTLQTCNNCDGCVLTNNEVQFQMISDYSDNESTETPKRQETDAAKVIECLKGAETQDSIGEVLTSIGKASRSNKNAWNASQCGTCGERCQPTRLTISLDGKPVAVISLDDQYQQT